MMLMVIVGIGAQDADKYAVKAPIKIQFWHALEAQYKPLIDKVIADFENRIRLSRSRQSIKAAMQISTKS